MTVLFMLDTDTCAFILRGAAPRLEKRLGSVPMRQQVMSVVTYAELLFGVRVSSRRKTNRAAVEAMVSNLQVLDWTSSAAEHYADIRFALRASGTMIGANDLMIAAHARSLDATVVTNNLRDFRRVRGLSAENWLD